jgi:branched-chain amino acid transport system ATP-binding protein
MAVSDKISVLNFGRKIAEGEPNTVRRAPEVIRAYLGEKAAHALGA